ncbi:hypothetical protein C1896_07695 [Pseudomonadaceae bacterium SI-3]|nr:hypothetical protein C1896_07695 [Pseudomonadaceae bacterium SI-3]
MADKPLFDFGRLVRFKFIQSPGLPDMNIFWLLSQQAALMVPFENFTCMRSQTGCVFSVDISY